jgi:hypothetical protein
MAVLVGILLIGLADRLISSNYPPCDLVSKGVGISTFGCSNSNTSAYPCKNEIPNSNNMAVCVQQNYYREKTFPFGFKQHFGPNSNLLDQKPLNENRLASFVLGFMFTIVLLYAFQSREDVNSPYTSN